MSADGSEYIGSTFSFSFVTRELALYTHKNTHTHTRSAQSTLDESEIEKALGDDNGFFVVEYIG